MKFYLDTNIWLDYFLNRSSGLKPIGEYAFQFLRKALETKSVLYYSDLVVRELNKSIGEQKSNELFESYKELLVLTSPNKMDLLETKKLVESSKIHYADALHVTLCKKEGAILVTRDKHFLEIDFIEVLLPEEIILD